MNISFGKGAGKNEETSYPHSRARSKADPRIKRERPRPAIKGPRNSRVTGSLDLTAYSFFFVSFLRRSDELPRVLCEFALSPHSLAAFSAIAARDEHSLRTT